jgi:hypothetical protein
VDVGVRRVHIDRAEWLKATDKFATDDFLLARQDAPGRSRRIIGSIDSHDATRSATTQIARRSNL